MGQVNDVFNKDAGVDGITGVGQVLQGHANPSGNVAAGSGVADSGIGATFMTEPLYAQFVELLTEQSFVRDIARTIPMDQPTLRVPAITSGLSVYAANEGAEAAATQMAASDFLLQANKIMAQVVASAELYEDSVQNIEKIITDDFVRAIAQAEEQAFLLGRTTAPDTRANGALIGSGVVTDLTGAKGSVGALTQFINKTTDGSFDYAEWGQVSDLNVGSAAAKIASSPLTICDGVLTTALDEDNVIDMQGASFYGANAYKAIREAIYKLGLLGRNRQDLVLILNPVSANQLLQSEELLTLDKYGSNATIITGEVGSLFGVKIIESSFIPSAGITVSGGTAGNTGDNGEWGAGGYGVLVHKPSLMLGDLRKVQVENERIIQNDAFRTVISERIAFGMERRSGAVAIGNMDSSIAPMTSTSVFFAGGVAPSITSTKSALEVSGTTTGGTDTTTIATTGPAVVSFLGYSGAVPDSVAITADNVALTVAVVLDASVVILATGQSSGDAGEVTAYFQAVEAGKTSETIAITVTST